MNWNCKPFDALNTKELYALLQIRNAVFIVEQNCPYQDLDDKDFKSFHLWAADKDGKILAYARLLPKGVSYSEASIGRVLTSMKSRKSGMGKDLMNEAIRILTQEWKESSVRISAQNYLEHFYQSLGFLTMSEPYMEDDIPHIEMLLKV